MTGTEAEEDGDTRAELHALTTRLRRLLEREREGGLAVLPDLLPARAEQEAPKPATAHPSPPPRPPAASAAAAPAFTPRVRPLDLPSDALAPFGSLPDAVAGCTRCALAATRTCTVFGEGTAPTELVFCGEAPGFEEDRSGRPFVGKAGELLSAMIEKGMQMRREDVFVLNTLKCRPPDNRNPSAEELAACRPHLAAQLAVLRPRVIVALGNAATRSLLAETTGITRLRGRVFEAFGAKVVPTYHPAYLLRTPAAKREAWADLQKVMALLAATNP